MTDERAVTAAAVDDRVTGDGVPRRGRVIGVDLGSRRIGVAASDDAQRLAVPVTRVDRRGDLAADRRALARLVAEYEAVGMVVGLPRSLSGALGPAARAATDEIDELRAVVGVAVDTVDERLTTVTASSGLRQAGRKAGGQRAVIDQAAAAELLQTWLDRRRSGRADG